MQTLIVFNKSVNIFFWTNIVYILAMEIYRVATIQVEMIVYPNISHI